MAGNIFRNKKAMFYLLTVIVFLAFVMVLLYTYRSYSYREEQESIEERIRAMDDFINNFHNDVYRSVRISGTRAFIAMEDYATFYIRYFDNKSQMEDYFKEAFYYGTFNGTPVVLMSNATFQDYMTRVNSSATMTSMEFYINVSGITFYQVDPWHVTIDINATVRISDHNNLAAWNYNKTFTTRVPIADLRDPLYAVETEGDVHVSVKQSNFTYFVDPATNDTSNLLEHLNGTYYYASPDAPSFLKRFYGDKTSDPNGIESMIDLEEFEDQGADVYPTRSLIDHEYFNGVTADVCYVLGNPNMPDWFKITTPDVNRYNINYLNYTTC